MARILDLVQGWPSRRTKTEATEVIHVRQNVKRSLMPTVPAIKHTAYQLSSTLSEYTQFSLKY